MSAEIKGLKAIYYNKDEAFITRGFRNWRQATENFRVHEESDCHKDYVNQFPAGNYMFKINDRNTRTRCKICSKLTIKTQERRHWRRSGVFIVNFEHISHLVLVFLLLTLSR